jgi:DNA mismatch endonuclease (patch repair protein)
VSDVFSREKRSQIMRRVRGRDTSPERKVRRLLTWMGLRYRLHRRDLPGSPDVVFAGKRVALFVHGCFWHGHDCARGARTPKVNADYWIGKIARNRARDADVQRRLTEAGWRAVVVWECELKDEARLAERLAAELEIAPAESLRLGGSPSSRPEGAKGI